MKSLPETVESLKYEMQQLKQRKLSLLTCTNLDIPTSGEKPDQETVSASSNKPAMQPTIGQLQVV